MVKHLAIAGTLAALLGVVWAQGVQQTPGQRQQQQQLPPGTASLSGTVVAMGSNQPIAGAFVELRRIDCNNFSNPPETVTATTDTNGRFTFRSLRDGGWCIVATYPGGAFTPAEYMQRGTLGRGATIPISNGENVTGIQLAMAPTGGIAGRIRDVDGEFMAHARVQVMEAFAWEGKQRLYILQVVQTNDLGEYRFFWLPPGAYYIAVAPENTRGRNVVSVQPPPGSGGHREDVMAPAVYPRFAPNGDFTEETYLTVYYPGERDPARALPVDVQPGVTTSGIDLTLTAARVRSYHVRGTAVNTVTAEPAAGAQLRLAPREWSATMIMPTATADARGNFDIAGVVPGSYLLLGNMSLPQPAAQPGAPPTPPVPISGNLELEVNSAHVQNVQLVLGAGVAVTGRVTVEGMTAAAAPQGQAGGGQRGLSVNLVRQPDIVGLPVSQARGPVSPEGTFTLQNVAPGEYRVYVPPLLTSFQWGTPNIPPALQNAYVKAIRAGNNDVLAGRLRIAAGAGTAELQITLGNGGRIEGTVSSDRREPMPNVTVVLVPEGVLRERGDLYRTSSSDLSGRFRMQAIPPGAYKAYAFEEAPTDAWQNADFMRPHESRGANVDVREGNQSSVDLLMIPKTRR
jgi:hypothetical protein